MKIEYTTKFELQGFNFRKPKYKFSIKSSILKTHFKELMKLSFLYDSKEKSAYISEMNEEDFLILVGKIENSNDKRCATSHKKSVENMKKRWNPEKENSQCEHGDLGSRGYRHGSIVTCPDCGKRAEVW